MLYTFYGDDFTGSTDVLETLARAGVPSALFFSPPSVEDLAAFPTLKAIGIAGDSRSRSPQWMSAHLPAVFAALKSFSAPVTHYKTCSTFDSSPHIGSIGRAIEIGLTVFQPGFVPIVVGAPHLGRFVVFGNLFAAGGAAVFRIDRHPTMARHPVTPMHEADLRRHLALQTDLPIALLDIRSLDQHALQTALHSRPAAILFDTFDDSSLTAAGELIWQHACQAPLFAAGSSGLTESLISAWRAEGLVDASSPLLQPASRVDQLVAISGSCSPVTQQQIEHALGNGFAGIELHPQQVIADPAGALAEALDILKSGRSLVVYTALGPLSAEVAPASAALGSALGMLLRSVLHRSGVRRAVLCGGDTSSHALQQIPLRALTFVAPLTRGAPLCRAHAPGTPFQGVEFVLKGGQVGAPDFLVTCRGDRIGEIKHAS